MAFVETTTYDFFYGLSIDASFKKDARNFRKKYGLKKSGYSFENDFLGWEKDLADFMKNNSDLSSSYWSDRKLLEEKYKVPINLLQYFYHFLIFKHTRDYLKGISRRKNKNYSIVFSGMKYTDEEAWQDSGKPYIKLLIAENWSMNSIIKFLKSYKNRMNDFFISKQIPQINERKKKNHVRDDLIWKFNKKPLRELNEIAQSNFTYKNYAISKILKEQFGYAISFEAVKKIIQRQGKIRDN